MPNNHPHAYTRVLGMALDAPWALTRPMVHAVATILGHKLTGEAHDLAAFDRRPAASAATSGNLAVIPIHGVIAPRMNLMSDMSGGCTFEGLSQDLGRAMADPQIDTIVFDVDSPGGSVLGCSEFAREVMAARTKKRLIAHAHYQMCSAAYWIGSACSEIVASPSSIVGSVGVYSLHEDLSAALEKAGIKLTYIFAGEAKVDGNEAEPLTETARARYQAHVDGAYGRFVEDVALGRGRNGAQVKTGFGKGAAVAADEALGAGMIDRIATFDDTLARVLPSGTSLAAEPTHAASVVPATPQESSRTTGQERARQSRELESALLALGL